MPLPNIFSKEVSQQIIERIHNLSAETQPNWGTMNVAQMMAHCNVTYDFVYTDKYPKPTGLKKFMIKLFAKKIVVSERPYPKNGRTANEFLVAAEQDFLTQKERLTKHINQVVAEGEATFEGRESHSFGPLKTVEWNNMFYKHLDHHLTQFGV